MNAGQAFYQANPVPGFQSSTCAVQFSWCHLLKRLSSSPSISVESRLDGCNCDPLMSHAFHSLSPISQHLFHGLLSSFQTYPCAHTLICTSTCLSIHRSLQEALGARISTACIRHVFIILSLVDGNLGCSHSLAIVTEARLMVVQVSLSRLWTSLGTCPGVA